MELLRPSLPWGFAAGSGSVFGPAAISDTVIQCRNKTGRQISQQDKQRGQQTRAAASKTSTCCFLTGFRSYGRMFFVQFWSFFVPHCHGDVPLGVVRFLGAVAVLDTVQEQDWQANQPAGSASEASKRESKQDQHVSFYGCLKLR